MSDNKYFLDNDTYIRPQIDENAFRNWYSTYSTRLGLNPNPDDPRHFYDWRAAFAFGATPNSEGHWPSAFKMPGHPRMILNGKNTRTGETPFQNVFRNNFAEILRRLK